MFTGILSAFSGASTVIRIVIISISVLCLSGSIWYFQTLRSENIQMKRSLAIEAERSSRIIKENQQFQKLLQITNEQIRKQIIEHELLADKFEALSQRESERLKKLREVSNHELDTRIKTSPNDINVIINAESQQLWLDFEAASHY